MASRDEALAPFSAEERDGFLVRYTALLTRRGIARERRAVEGRRAGQSRLFLRAVLSFPGGFLGDSGTDDEWQDTDMATDAELVHSSDQWEDADEESDAVPEYGEDDIAVDEGTGANYHDFGAEETVDADDFYSGRERMRDLGGVLAWTPFTNDDEYSYRMVRKYGDRRFSNRSRRYDRNADGEAKFEIQNWGEPRSPLNTTLPKTSLGAYAHWEFHGRRRREETRGSEGTILENGGPEVYVPEASGYEGPSEANGGGTFENAAFEGRGLLLDATYSVSRRQIPSSRPSYTSSSSHPSETNSPSNSPPSTADAMEDDIAFLSTDSEHSLSDASAALNSAESTHSSDDFMATDEPEPHPETALDLETFSHHLPPEEYAFQTSASFPDMLSLSYLGHTGLRFENMRKYKNNLSAIITSGNDFFIMGHNSDLLVYDLDGATQLPKPRTCLRIDTKPPYTLSEDRLVSTWPYFPHTINFVKTYDNWLGNQVFAACFDDGLLRIWYTTTITKSIDRLGTSGAHTENSRLYGVKVRADFQIRLEASVWGVDLLAYKDSFGSSHHLVAVSDNSQRLSILYFHQRDSTFYHVTSHQVLHNVPSVSFAGFEVKDGVHKVDVTCASISGELLIFQAQFSLAEGPIAEKTFNPIYDTRESAPADINQFCRVQYTSPEVVSRTVLLDECWSAAAVSSAFFKPVESLYGLVGDTSFEGNREMAEVAAELEVLGLEVDPVKTSHVGLAAPLQFFQCKVRSDGRDLVEELGYSVSDDDDGCKLVSVDDEYRRLHKLVQRLYGRFWQKQPQESLNGKSYRVDASKVVPEVYLCVSTQKRVGLFRADSLVCNCCSPTLFDTNMPFDEETQYANRISIAHVIPELLAFVAVTQQGLILVLRLTQCRGIVGMRQEHVFPKAGSVIFTAGSTIRTIAGVAVRKGGPGRWWIYVTYTDGFMMGYALSQGEER